MPEPGAPEDVLLDEVDIDNVAVDVAGVEAIARNARKGRSAQTCCTNQYPRWDTADNLCEAGYPVIPPSTQLSGGREPLADL